MKPSPSFLFLGLFIVFVPAAAEYASGYYGTPRESVPIVLAGVAGLILATSLWTSATRSWAATARDTLVLALAVFSSLFLFDQLFLVVSRLLPGPGLYSQLTAVLLRLIGMIGVPQKGLLIAFDGSTSVDFLMTFEKTGLYQLLGMGTASLVLAATAGMRRIGRTLFLLAGLMVPYALLRTVLLIALYADYDAMGSFYNPLVGLLLWLPASGPVAWCFRATDAWPPCPIQLRPGWQAVGASAALAFLSATVLFVADPGERKQGRILVDESHSDWSRSDVAFDSQNLAKMSSYSYTAMRAYLAARYGPVGITPRGLLTEKALESCDVLIVRMPTRAYAPGEVAALKTFVAKGGGLLLVGDHTNLFGTTVFLNDLAAAFGMTLNSDDTFTLTTGQLFAARPPRLFRSPALVGVGTVGFQTSCTIAPQVGRSVVLWGKGLGAEDVDYGHVNFFGNMRQDPGDASGAFALAAATTWGRGRVLLFTDSTIWSSFSLFQSGRLDLLIAFIEYLNRGNTLAWRWGLMPVAGVLLSLSAGAATLLAARRGAFHQGLAAIAVGVLVAGFFVTALNEAAYTPQPPARPLPTIGFVADGRGFRLPDAIAETVMPDSAGRRISFTTFWTNIARLGWFPESERSLSDAIEQHQVVGLINPQRLDPEEALQAGTFLRRGGRLLILEPSKGDAVVSRALLAHVAVNTGKDGTPRVTHPRALVTAATQGGTGAEPVRGSEQVETYAVGAGHLICYYGSELLSDSVLGPTFNSPDSVETAGFQRQFELFRSHVLRGL